MPVEGRALASGELLKEMRSGDWSWPINTINFRTFQRKLYRKVKA
jgi:hypothetical protein